MTVLAMLIGLGLYNWNHREKNKEESTPVLVKLLFERDDIADCEAIPTPCVTDQQCVDNCQSGMFMTCQQGFCKRYMRDVEFVGVEDCDISRGMVMVLTALDTFLVQRQCISLYRDVIDDSSELRPYVCQPGRMNIDFEIKPFTIEDCNCAYNYRKFAYHQGAFARSTPVCIPSNISSLYSRVYDNNVRMLVT